MYNKHISTTMSIRTLLREARDIIRDSRFEIRDSISEIRNSKISILINQRDERHAILNRCEKGEATHIIKLALHIYIDLINFLSDRTMPYYEYIIRDVCTGALFLAKHLEKLNF